MSEISEIPPSWESAASGGTWLTVGSCCCGSASSASSTSGGSGDGTCCGLTGSESLPATITNKTGTCSCVPDSTTYTGAGPLWGTPTGLGCVFPNCIGADSLYFTCSSGVWTHNFGTLVSVDCDPFQLVFDISAGGGTFRVTITF